MACGPRVFINSSLQWRIHTSKFSSERKRSFLIGTGEMMGGSRKEEGRGGRGRGGKEEGGRERRGGERRRGQGKGGGEQRREGRRRGENERI